MSFFNFLSTFTFDPVLLLISVILFCCFFIFYLKKKKNQKPLKVKFSSLRNVKSAPVSLKVKLKFLPKLIRVLIIGLLCLAFAKPHLEKELKPDENKREEQKNENEKKDNKKKKIKVPTEGISIQIVLDRSSSMDSFDDRFRGVKTNYVKFEGLLLSKMDVVKTITKRFINGANEKSKDGLSGRWSDLIGLYTFARAPFIACPLTLRHDLLIDYIDQVETVKRNEEDGTYIGYALERAILQIIDTREKAKNDNSYEVKSSIIVLVTDGAQAIRAEDQNDRHKSLLPTHAAELAKANQIKIYSIVIKPKVIFDSQGTAYDPRAVFRGYDFDTTEVEKVAQITGGKYYNASDGESLLNIVEEINQLEKTKLPNDKELEVEVQKSKELKNQETEKTYLFIPLLWLSLALILFEIVMTHFYFKRIP